MQRQLGVWGGYGIEGLEGGRFATESDRKPYGWGQKFGRNDQDVYVVDLNSGARTKALEKVRHYFGGSSTGYLKNYNYDNRLRYSSPPHAATLSSAAFQVIQWAEIQNPAGLPP